MRILFIGVVVGAPGRRAIKSYLSRLAACGDTPDLVICNANHAASGLGLTQETSRELFDAGVDVITMGEDIWSQKELQTTIDSSPNILRPQNLPVSSPGHGILIKEIGGEKIPVGIINLSGYSYIKKILPENPFPIIYNIIDEMAAKTNCIVVDFFARTTAEKIAMRYHLDGKISLLSGTGTLVQTADESLSKLGTAYITDVGIAGPVSGVTGFDATHEIERFTSYVRSFPKIAEGDLRFNAILVSIDDVSGMAKSIVRINETIPI